MMNNYLKAVAFPIGSVALAYCLYVGYSLMEANRCELVLQDLRNTRMYVQVVPRGISEGEALSSGFLEGMLRQEKLKDEEKACNELRASLFNPFK